MTEEEYDAIFEKIEAMRTVMNEDQVEKLDMVLDLLKEQR